MSCFIPVSYQLFGVGRGPSGLIQKLVHPCQTFFIQMMFKRVAVCCTDCFLPKFVPPIRSEKKCLLNSMLHLCLFSLAVCPLVRLSRSSWKNVSNGIDEKPRYILKTSIRSDLFMRSSNDHNFRISSLNV